MVISLEERLASPYLARLSRNLISRLERSGMKKPDFAASIGMSGSQFRYIRGRAANPTIRTLASISKRLGIPLYELLEDAPLRDRRNPSADKMVATLSSVVKHKFHASGMSNKEFANFISMSLPQFYLIIRGESSPSLLVVEEIANRLELRLWQLLGVEDYDDGNGSRVARARPRRAAAHAKKAV